MRHLIDAVRQEKVTFTNTLSATSACSFATKPQMTAGTGITSGDGTIIKHSVITKGNIIYTDIIIDLTGLTSTNQLGDIIGVDGAANCHLGQITQAVNGTILGGTMTCIENPAGGERYIDLYSAEEATGAENAAITSLTETVVLNTTADWKIAPDLGSAAGTIKSFDDVPDNGYLYLTVGTNSSPTAGEYTAGRFIIQMWGYK